MTLGYNHQSNGRKWPLSRSWNRHTFRLMTQNQPQSGFERGAYRFDWSFSIYERLRLHTQYFNGYGESLIDYDYQQHPGRRAVIYGLLLGQVLIRLRSH